MPGGGARWWLRAIGWTVGAAVRAIGWGVGLAFLLTGLVLWHHWHALAKSGVEQTAQVERCAWEGLFKRGSSGFYSCDYAYRPLSGGPSYDGHFQSHERLEPGQAILIRYLPDQPATSATAQDLEHPSVTPGAMAALGAGWLGWLAWQARGERAGGGGGDP